MSIKSIFYDFSGLIPWDDDLDICILEENEERLINSIRKVLGKKYFVDLKKKSP